MQFHDKTAYVWMGILPLKKRVNRDKCSFATKQRMFGVFAIDEILRYRGTRFPGSRTLCHPAVLLYLSNCEIWSNGDQILRFGQIYNFFWKPGDSVKLWNFENFLPLNFTFLSKWGLAWIGGWAFGQPLSPLRTIFSKAGVAYTKRK